MGGDVKGMMFVIVGGVVCVVLPFAAFLYAEDGCFDAGCSGRMCVVLPFAAFSYAEDGCLGAGCSGRMWEWWTARHNLHGLTWSKQGTHYKKNSL